MSLYGEYKDSGDKKLKRLTLSMSDLDYDFIADIANCKNLSQSEAVNLLLKPMLKRIEEQENLIVENPRAVAFDLVTREK